MKKLKQKTIRGLVDFWQSINLPPMNDTFNAWYAEANQVSVRIEMPAGELTNQLITGYIWAWGAQKRIETAPITGKDTFAAQGLEGKAVVRGVALTTALLVWQNVDPRRIALYIESDPQDYIGRFEKIQSVKYSPLTDTDKVIGDAIGNLLLWGGDDDLFDIPATYEE